MRRKHPQSNFLTITSHLHGYPRQIMGTWFVLFSRLLSLLQGFRYYLYTHAYNITACCNPTACKRRARSCCCHCCELGLSKHKLSRLFCQTKKVLHILISRVDPKTDHTQIVMPMGECQPHTSKPRSIAKLFKPEINVPRSSVRVQDWLWAGRLG
ncbi:hypothetical protein HZ326_11993 [Fusarium oxysporum f. sp. albedinis]|nr:hypothetical protein HZ326_11993 [Fusarium oxysporum f. sp. albedinis]